MTLFPKELRLKAILALVAAVTVAVVLALKFVVFQTPVAASNRDAPEAKSAPAADQE